MKVHYVLFLAAVISGCGPCCPVDEKPYWYKEQGDYYYQHGKWHQARAEYVAALGKDEEYVEAAVALVYTCRMIAAVAELKGEPGAGKSRQEAIAWANHALEHAPGNADAHYAAALALNDLDRFDEADAQLHAALDARSPFPLAHLEMARSSYRRAERELRLSAEPKAAPAAAVEHKALAMQRLKSAADSVEAYLRSYREQFQRPAPEDQDLQRWVAVLRDMAAHDGVLTEDARALLHLLDPERHRAPVIHERDLPR